MGMLIEPIIKFLEKLAEFEKSVVDTNHKGVISLLIICNLIFAMGIIFAVVLLMGFINV